MGSLTYPCSAKTCKNYKGSPGDVVNCSWGHLHDNDWRRGGVSPGHFSDLLFDIKLTDTHPVYESCKSLPPSADASSGDFAGVEPEL